MDDRMDQPGEPGSDEQQSEFENVYSYESRQADGENIYTDFESEAAEDAAVAEVPDKDDKLWAMLCHLSALVSYLGVPFGNIVGPLVIWLIKKDESAFVDVNGKKALNFQISLTIYGLASLPLICGGPLILIVYVPLMIVGLIFPIIAAVGANKGEEINYPLSIKFIK